MKADSVTSVMTRDVFAVAPDTSLETAKRLLTTKRISGVPVVGEDGRPLGVVTHSDLVDPDRPPNGDEGYPLFYRVVDGETVEMGDHVEVGSGRVSDVMSPYLLTVAATDSLSSAASIMVNERVHRLLVMEGNELVGIVSALDVLRGMSRAFKNA